MGLTKALWDRLGDQKRLTGRGQHSKSLSHAHWELYKNIGTGVPTADSDLTDLRGFVVSSSAALFSFCLQAFPESGSFPVGRLFTSSAQSIRALASASILPMMS